MVRSLPPMLPSNWNLFLCFSPFSFHNEVSKPCSLLPEINFLLSKNIFYSAMPSTCNSILILEGCRIIEMEQERVKSITGRVIQGRFHPRTESHRSVRTQPVGRIFYSRFENWIRLSFFGSFEVVILSRKV